jgi:hypothetical protein
MTPPEPLISDTAIFGLVESVLQNDEVVAVMDAHRIMVALRDEYEAERRARPPVPTDDIRHVLNFFAYELDHRPSTRPLVARVRLWLDAVAEAQQP